MERTFDRVFAFAVLHHLPGAATRLNLLRAIAMALKPGGEAVISNWQFLSSARLSARIVPWERVGLSNEHVDPGDYLLDWRRGGLGYRYVHNLTEGELWGLAAEAGLTVVEHYYSDGEGGRLGRYTRLKLLG